MSAEPQESSAPLAEISHGPNAFEEFLERNQKSLIAFAILLAIATAAFVIYQGIAKSARETAGAALNQADDLSSLQAVIAEHPDTNAAKSAMVLLAEQQWTDGQQDAAIETLRSFVSANPNHPAFPSAQASLGSKLTTVGKPADAIKVFEEILADPNSRFVAPFALISSGDIARVSGDTEKAKSSYNRVKTEYAESGFVDTATRRLASLNAKAPVEIEAPPEPETPAANTSGNPPPFTITPEPTPSPDTAPAPAAPATNDAPAQTQETSPQPRSEQPGEQPADPES